MGYGVSEILIVYSFDSRCSTRGRYLIHDFKCHISPTSEIYNTSHAIRIKPRRHAMPNHAAQTSPPVFSIQLPSSKTLESQSCNLVRILSICFMSNTLGCTQLIRAISSTWSMLPLKSPKLNAFMIRCSISSGRTLVSSAMVRKDIARS
jgi:hypothetical protein